MTATEVSDLSKTAIEFPIRASYVLPIRHDTAQDLTDLTAYLRSMAALADVIVVDGSPGELFAQHAAAWDGITHVAPDPTHTCLNGKVAGVLTGLDHAAYDRVVIADDDVRYDEASLRRVITLLDEADVVRPQNYFAQMPWHARWDTARSLLNRAVDGDWPGTLAVRRSALASAGGYEGDCLFENLELVRTVLAAGGREVVARDVVVRRQPPTARHFWSQRVRQAYDEFARPRRLAGQLALLPLGLLLAKKRPSWVALAAVAATGIAEYGRRRDGGTAVFPATASLMAPLWLAERAVCSWLAVATRLRYGGVRYRGRVISKAATSQAELNRRHRRSEVSESRMAVPV